MEEAWLKSREWEATVRLTGPKLADGRRVAHRSLEVGDGKGPSSGKQDGKVQEYGSPTRTPESRGEAIAVDRKNGVGADTHLAGRLRRFEEVFSVCLRVRQTYDPN